jgi:hypothetical protein
LAQLGFIIVNAASFLPPTEGISREAQVLGGLGFVAVGSAEGFSDQSTFDFVDV